MTYDKSRTDSDRAKREAVQENSLWLLLIIVVIMQIAGAIDASRHVGGNPSQSAPAPHHMAMLAR